MNYLNLLFTLWNIFVYSFLNGHEAHRKSEELYNLLNILSKTNKCCLIENAPKNCTYKKLVYSDLVYIKISIYCIAPTSEETYIAQYYPITHDMRYLETNYFLGYKRPFNSIRNPSKVPTRNKFDLCQTNQNYKL
ncbi:hypothetical protein A3Q56_05482 [Intoshia linei]|uniref:Uncharacterized protein n=1 Tax=Intoshia linei TaxID=1819745 RepID=A0A177AZ78_9BILA|nr:hypothetical protein A3Q56_05482 [Intoshia linei]